MAGKSTRDKGRRGECAAKKLLADYDYELIADTTAGLATGDLVVESPDGKIWDVEVKNRRVINVPQFVGQAMKNAGKRRWMVLAKIHGTTSWLVIRKGMKPAVWHSKKGEV
jgi:hypothetical protein